jgi:hypothetical protein
MEAVGGSLDEHDHEFASVRWISLPDALELLTFETERNLVARVAERADAEAGAPVEATASERGA